MVEALFLALISSTPTLHVKVDGTGFLRFAKAGHAVYANEATLVSRDGLVETPDGLILLPQVHASSGVGRLSVSLDGRILAGPDTSPTQLGQIVLAVFAEGVGGTGFFSTSSHASLMTPGDGIAGVIRASAPGQPTQTTAKPALKQQVELDVSQKSEVDHDDLTLGDVATIHAPKELKDRLEAISLGRAPLYGTTRGFSVSYLTAKVRSIGLKVGEFALDVPDGATVLRKAQTITQDQFVQSALDAIKAKFDFDVALLPSSPVPSLVVPTGKLDLQANIDSKTDRSITVLITALVDGQTIGSRVLTMTAGDQQVGVKPGDAVTIRMIAGGAVVELPGRASTGGWIGQTIRVVSDTGSIHDAKVVSANIVEVRL